MTDIKRAARATYERLRRPVEGLPADQIAYNAAYNEGVGDGIAALSGHLAGLIEDERAAMLGPSRREAMRQHDESRED